MTTFVPHETDSRMAELEERTREAWTIYSDRLRGLDGELYELEERDSWAELQAALREIDNERGRVLAAAGSAPG